MSFLLGAPELHAGLDVESHLSGVEGQNHLPQPAGHTSLDAAQETVGLLGSKYTPPGHVELLVNHHPQVLLLRAALNPLSAQHVFVLAIAPTHVQDLALVLVELHEVHTGPPLLSRSLWMASLPSSVSTTLHSLVLSANLLRAHSMPLTMLPTKMLNSTSPSTSP